MCALWLKIHPQTKDICLPKKISHPKLLLKFFKQLNKKQFQDECEAIPKREN